MRLIPAAFLLFAGLLPTTVRAQDPAPQPIPDEPIGRYVLDLRGVMARFKQVPTTAAALDVDGSDLPTRGFGLSLGAHVYPFRKGRLALGLGVDLLLRARGRHTIPAATATAPEGPTVITRLSAFAPQISLNFGKREGWSYVSGGIGSADYTIEREDDPARDPESRPRTINYGGGARWFAKKHLAFCFDLRFYAIQPQLVSAGRAPVPRSRLLVMSAGIATR